MHYLLDAGLCEFNETDFDGDKIQLYNDVRESMV